MSDDAPLLEAGSDVIHPTNVKRMIKVTAIPNSFFMMFSNQTVLSRDGIFLLCHFGIIKSRRICCFGEKVRLRELRKARGLSQVKLAMDLNISQNTLSRYENREREAGYDTLIKIADYFDVSIDYLLGRTDEPNGK